MSLPFLALALLLAMSQASAFSASSTLAGQTTRLPNASQESKEKEQWKVEIHDYGEDEDEDEWDEWDDEDEDYEEDEEEDYEEDEEEIFEEDEEEEEDDDWTPEQYVQMELLYERYVQEIVNKYGADWEEHYELVVDKEEIYEKYLEFEERKQREAEEQRELTQASHALLRHQESVRVDNGRLFDNDSQNRTEEKESARCDLGDAIAADLPPRTHVVVVNTGISYYNYNHKDNKAQISENECPAKNTIVKGHRGNTQSVIGSI